MTRYDIDQGAAFGTWSDPVSRFMYQDSMPPILTAAKLTGHVGDFGGANGLLKAFYPNVTTIDTDDTKGPDIVDDILNHRGSYDTGWCRYVLHYLSDREVIRFLDYVKVPRMIVVQFVNDEDDLRLKYANSYGEKKFFRTGTQLRALLPRKNRLIFSRPYRVTPEFYRNRLKLDNAVEHGERLEAYEIVL